MGQKATLKEADLNNIHQLGQHYNEIEQPMLIHPGLEDFSSKLSFDNSGRPFSFDERAQYTIDTCKIDRKTANNERKMLLDELITGCQDYMRQYQTTNDPTHLNAIKVLIKAFQKAAEHKFSTYRTFRQYVAKHLTYANDHFDLVN